MTMNPVNSSFIESVGHDADSKVMRVKMKSGKVYDHPDVSAERHQALLDASSAGKHYNANFKGK